MAINLGSEAKPLPDLPGTPIHSYPPEAGTGNRLDVNSVVVTAPTGGRA